MNKIDNVQETIYCISECCIGIFGNPYTLYIYRTIKRHMMRKGQPEHEEPQQKYRLNI